MFVCVCVGVGGEAYCRSEVMVTSSENLELSNILFFKPGVDQNIHVAPPTARISEIQCLPSLCFPFFSSSFFFPMQCLTGILKIR